MPRFIAHIVLLALFAAPALSQEKPQERIISAQIRLRSEVDGRGVLDDETVLLHLLRSRIRATLRPIDGITMLAEVQDARHWGQSNPALGRGTTDADADQLDMHQAWVQLDSLLGLPLNLRVGRQEMTFANERFIGVSNWSNTGRSFDAARATLAGDGLSLDLFAARLSAAMVDTAGSQNFYGVWGAWRPGAALAVDLFVLRDDNTAEIARGEDAGRIRLERYTLGGYSRLQLEPIDVEFEVAVQSGASAASDSVPRRAIGAAMISLMAGLTVDESTKTRIYGLATGLSDDLGPDANPIGSFSTLFGTNHRLYGQMDYVPELAGNAGLIDYSAGITSTPIANLRAVLEGHLLEPADGEIADFGSEVDLTFFWRANRAFELSGGGGIFMPGPLLETRLGGSHARYWMYLSGQFDF